MAGRVVRVSRALIDLRSDTVTLPTPRMRSVMASCEVGDDVYREDPTVNHLEKVGAEFLGKESAIFLPSGSMANLIAIACHTNRGDEILCGDKSHIFHWEAGGASALLGVSVYPICTSPDGSLMIERLTKAIRPVDDHCATTRLLALENTHNMCGGKVLHSSYLHKVGDWCKSNGILLHMDGARLVNASIASGVAPHVIAQRANSVSMCLSKGMSAPVGSLLAGTAEFITKARRVRKMLGGGMRQAGVIASAGLVALEEYPEVIRKDHQNALRLETGLIEMGFKVTPVETNIVNLHVGHSEMLASDANSLVECVKQELRSQGVLVSGVCPGTAAIRAVTHRNVNELEVDIAIGAMRTVKTMLGL